jgi:hypothetical protein
MLSYYPIGGLRQNIPPKIDAIERSIVTPRDHALTISPLRFERGRDGIGDARKGNAN